MNLTEIRITPSFMMKGALKGTSGFAGVSGIKLCSLKDSIIFNNNKVTMDPTPSIFTPFFVVKEGVISLNLRSMNIVTSAAIFIYIFAAVYQTCTDGTFVCDETHFPWISDFIKLPFYDRIFCMLTMVHSFTSMLGVIRSFWKIQHDIGTSDLYNGIAAFFGCVSVVALPGDALCDRDNFGILHHYMALSFFLGTVVYAIMVTYNLVCNYSKFSTQD